MKLKPLVTVIIPVYNTGKYLAKCLNSVINQSYLNLKIIIVNDGSTDNSANIIQYFNSIDNRINVFSKENGGSSSARNLGLEYIEGEYVIFIDSDDWWELNAVEILVREAEKNNYDLVMPQKFVKVFSSGVSKVENVFDVSDINDNILEFVIKTIIGKSRAWRVTSVLYRVSIIKRFNITFPNGYTAEDVVFNLDFLKRASKIGFLEEITLNVNKREGSITSSYRYDFPELALYLDKAVDDFYNYKNIKTSLSQAAKDSMLCRNIIIFLFLELSRINTKPNLEKNKRIEEVLANIRIKEAFNNKIFIYPYWNSKLKVALVVFIRKLLHLKMRKIAIIIIRLINMLNVK